MASKILRVTVRDSGKILADQCVLANGMLGRLVGLLDRDHLATNEALLLEPCQQVHTLFMRFAIDAVFLTKDNEVVAWQSLVPWRLSKMYFKARKVLELPMGTCEKVSLHPGQILELRT